MTTQEASTGFFPSGLKVLDDEAASDRFSKIAFVEGYIRNGRIAELIVDLDEEMGRHKPNNFTVDGDKHFLLKQAYSADLFWIVGELKGTLLSWTDGEIGSAVAKQRVQSLVSALDKKILEG